MEMPNEQSKSGFAEETIATVMVTFLQTKSITIKFALEILDLQ